MSRAPVAIVAFRSYAESVPEALEKIGAGQRLSGETAVLLKPNLVSASPHPVTTPAACCEAIVAYVRSCSSAKIMIAEGTGDAFRETDEVFDLLGYTKLAARYGVELLDLNTAPLRRLENHHCHDYTEFYLPDVAFTHFIISVPVLKAHSLAIITGSMKNMMGFAPPRYYAGGPGGWKKAQMHHRMQQAILDLNRYCRPDLTVMDASVGLADYHLGGRRCDPPVEKILAGFDAAAVDRQAATLLGLDWRTIPHLVDNTKTGV